MTPEKMVEEMASCGFQEATKFFWNTQPNDTKEYWIKASRKMLRVVLENIGEIVEFELNDKKNGAWENGGNIVLKPEFKKLMGGK